MNMASLLTNAYTLVVVVLLFGLTIFIHELGHFLVARWCGLVIDAFSIGFGPAIWKRKINGVLYKIGVLPFGGYVALPQMEPGGEDHGAEGSARRDLPPISPWKKILVALAGVTGNMILAIVIAHVVYWGGKSFAPPEGTVALGYVETNAPAYEAGLRIGDVIESVNGSPVRNWDEFILSSALRPEPELKIRHLSGEEATVTLPTEEFFGTRYIPGLLPLNYCYVLNVRPGSPAEAAGLASGDKIVGFNGRSVYSREELMELVDAAVDQEVPIAFERGGEVLHAHVRPAYDAVEKRGLIGIQFNQLDVKRPWAQIKSHTMLIVRLLRALVTPHEARAAAGAVGGPVAIFTMFWLYVQGSFIMALWFTCLLNVNLAVLNLLPIPVLDGGHIMLALWEGLTRRKVSHKFIGLVWNVFFVLIFTLFAMLTWRDVQRVREARHQRAAAEEAGTNEPPAGEPAP